MADKLFTFVKDGKTERITLDIYGLPSEVWPVTRSAKDAERFCRFLNDSEVKPKELNTEDNTYAKEYQLALADGCKYLVDVCGWGDNGNPLYRAMSIPPKFSREDFDIEIQ